MRGLFLLEFRRGLRSRAAWIAAGILVLLLATSGTTAHARQTLWAATLLLFLPAIVGQAAGLVPGWRRGEGDWIGSRPVGKSATLGAALAGVVVSGAVWLALATTLIEARTSEPDAWTRDWQRDLNAFHTIDAGKSRRIELSPPAHEGKARIRVRVRPTVGGKPNTDLRVSVARAGEGKQVLRHVTHKTWIELELPPGSGSTWLQIDNLGDGNAAWVTPGSVEVFVPTTSSAGPRLWIWMVRLGAMLAAAAVGFSAWVRPAAATAAALCLVPAGSLLGGLWASGLSDTLASIADHRIPPAPPFELLPVVTIIAGIALARLGLVSWRHSR